MHVYILYSYQERSKRKQVCTCVRVLRDISLSSNSIEPKLYILTPYFPSCSEEEDTKPKARQQQKEEETGAAQVGGKEEEPAEKEEQEDSGDDSDASFASQVCAYECTRGGGMDSNTSTLPTSLRSLSEGSRRLRPSPTIRIPEPPFLSFLSKIT